MLSAVNLFIYLLLAVLVAGSLLPICSSPHWLVRSWDYPRVQILVIAISASVVFLAINLIDAQPSRTKVATVIGVTLLLAGWHLFRIVPYTKLVSPQAMAWEPPASPSQDDSRRLRVMVSNVEMENDQFVRWCNVVRDAEADVIVVAEVDDRWAKTLEKLKPLYPHQIVHTQDNWYGMAMISRLPITEYETRFLVQDDVPSIDAVIEMPSGDRVRVIGVHPRPPEPIRDNDAIARDAELVLWGKELAEDDRPIVIGGDLNDVAWSQSTRLFLRLSGLLDPRRGRGFFNSFHADHPCMRFPLDHVFHSGHFAIRDMQRLSHVGSDHFPIVIDLQLTPTANPDHDPLEKKSNDEAKAEVRLGRAEDEHELDAEPIDEAGRNL